MNVSYMRNNIKRQIDSNPTEILLSRENFISDGMDGETQDPDNPVVNIELRVKLYNKNYSPTIALDSGVSFNKNLKALCVYNADIKENDTFVVDNETIKVKNVRMVKYNGEIISKEVTLEKVK